MSALYGRVRSDRRKTDATAGANQEIEFTITYGSANDPKVAIYGVVSKLPDGSFYLWTDIKQSDGNYQTVRVERLP